jgi:hypothetical protein
LQNANIYVPNYICMQAYNIRPCGASKGERSSRSWSSGPRPEGRKPLEALMLSKIKAGWQRLKVWLGIGQTVEPRRPMGPLLPMYRECGCRETCSSCKGGA